MPLKSHTVYEVFTPTSQARLNFVARADVDKRLEDSLMTPGKQVVVYGESGSGKSTLLQRTLDKIYGTYLTTACSRAMTFDDLLLDAFDQLDVFYTDTKFQNRATTVSTSMEAQYMVAKAAVAASSTNSSTETSRRALPPQITAQRLGRFMGDKGLCWVIEDFHKIAASEKIHLSQTLKIFSDLARTYAQLRIVTIGATDTAREVVEYDNEMRNRVAEIHVPLMSPYELSQIVSNGGLLLNVKFERIREKITSFSSGLASVTHHLALNACIAAGVTHTQAIRKNLLDSEMNKAMAVYIAESSDTLKRRFDTALRRERERSYHNTELLVKAIASGPFDGLTHAGILGQIRQTYAEYPSGNVTLYLRKLQEEDRGALIRRSTNGRYRFIDPVLHSYARVLFKVGRDNDNEAEWFSKFADLINEHFGAVGQEPGGDRSVAP